MSTQPSYSANSRNPTYAKLFSDIDETLVFTGMDRFVSPDFTAFYAVQCKDEGQTHLVTKMARCEQTVHDDHLPYLRQHLRTLWKGFSEGNTGTFLINFPGCAVRCTSETSGFPHFAQLRASHQDTNEFDDVKSPVVYLLLKKDE